MALGWLYLDMNSFFAAVEQQERPELRGSPVVVAPVDSESTCCIAASREAKAFGIRTGTNVGEARRLCPGLEVVVARHRPYREYSEAIERVVESCLPVTRKLYVDEMYCKLWDNERRTEDAVALGQRVKAEIKRQVGECLSCSVGLSVNEFLAKIAAELQKPDGLIVIEERDLPHALYRLRLRDFPGISKRMEARFNRYGIYNTEQMCALTQEQIRQVWNGVLGDRWWQSLRGEDVPAPPTTRGSVSHSHVLSPELRTRQGAATVASHLLEKAATRMRALGYHARGLSVYVRSSTHESWSRKTRFAPCQDPWTLLGLMRSLWEHPFAYPKQVGVVLYDVVRESDVTLPLFSEQEQRLRAARAVDLVNQRFGKGKVTMASILPVYQYAAEDKIAFGKV